MNTIKILHVDDDPGYRELLEAMVAHRDAGFSFTGASSAGEALVLLEQDSFDCIISDFQMPRMNGLDFLKAIREKEAKLPFVFLTGQGSESVAAEALRSGATSYFAKDTEFALVDRLSNTLRNTVQAHRAWLERQQTNAELRKLEHAVMKSPSLIVITNAKAEFEFCNTRFEEFTGYTREDVIGKNPRLLQSGLTPASVYEELWATIRRGETWRGTLVNRKKNGDMYWESASISALRDDSGDIIQFIKVGEDITDSLAREEKIDLLSKQYRDLEDIINSGPSVVFLWRNEPGWPVEYISRNISQYGYTPEQFLSGKLMYRDIIHPDDLRQVTEQTESKRNALSETRFEQKYRILTASGEEQWIQDITWVKRNSAGEITHFEGFILDYNSKKQLEVKLEKRTEELQERIKEFGISNTVSRILAENGDPTQTIFRRVANLIPFGFFSPESTAVRITYHGTEFRTSGFDPDRQGLAVPLKENDRECGGIEVQSIIPDGETDPSLFSDSKLSLLTSLGEMISLFLEKRRALELITSARNFYLHLLDDLPTPMWRCDAKGAFNFFNRALVSFIGKDLKSDQAEEWGTTIHPEDRARAFQLFLSSLETKLPVTASFRLMHADGGYHSVVSHTNPIFDETGEFLGMIGSVVDLTEEIESKRTIAESEERYRNLVEMASDGIVIVQGSRFVYSNPACASIVGYSVEEMLRLQLVDVLHPDVRDAVIRNYERRLAGENVTTMYETALLSKTGEKLFVEIHSRRIIHQGQTAIFVIVRDLTSRRQLQLELAHAQKLEAIGQLAAGIAHEINTPIQFIGDNTRFLKKAFADLAPMLDAEVALTDQEVEPSRQLELINDLRSSLNGTDLNFLREEIPLAVQQSLDGLGRVAKIVRAMKSFAHPGTDEKVDSDINKIIEDIATVSRNEWKYIADLHLELDADLPLIPCLPNEMSQVFLNLIINAAHAIEQVVGSRGEKKGSIVISTCRNNGTVEIAIQDTGAGIPDAIKNRIFTPFFTTKPMGRGTGQGLAISLDVVANRHNGKLSFESQEGKGTRFLIQLPVHTQSTLQTLTIQENDNAVDVR